MHSISTASFFRGTFLVVTIAVGALWLSERATATAQERQLADLQRAHDHLNGLRALRDQRREQRAAATATPTAVPSPTPDRPLDRLPAPAPTFPLGEWTPASAWKNEGQATPRATLATFLWAAAGGDLIALENTLAFDDVARERSRAWLESLPIAARSLYATPESLVASATIKNIPLTAAQLTWFHQADTETATVGLLMAAPQLLTAENQTPNTLAVLTLQRSAIGWRIVVPATAIDHLANPSPAPPSS